LLAQLVVLAPTAFKLLWLVNFELIS